MSVFALIFGMAKSKIADLYFYFASGADTGEKIWNEHLRFNGFQ